MIAADPHAIFEGHAPRFSINRPMNNATNDILEFDVVGDLGPERIARQGNRKTVLRLPALEPSRGDTARRPTPQQYVRHPGPEMSNFLPQYPSDDSSTRPVR